MSLPFSAMILSMASFSIPRDSKNFLSMHASCGVDRISNVAVQVQTWTSTPERRNAFDRAIDAALATLGLPRSTLNLSLIHIYKPQCPDGRCVWLLDGGLCPFKRCVRRDGFDREGR